MFSSTRGAQSNPSVKSNPDFQKWFQKSNSDARPHASRQNKSKIKMKLENKSAPIDQAIFDSFSKLISHDEKVRIKGAGILIKTLEESSEEKVSR